jgi:hypothetical protein
MGIGKTREAGNRLEEAEGSLIPERESGKSSKVVK